MYCSGREVNYAEYCGKSSSSALSVNSAKDGKSLEHRQECLAPRYYTNPPKIAKTIESGTHRKEVQHGGMSFAGPTRQFCTTQKIKD